MILKNTCQDNTLDLYIVKTACKFIKFSVVLLFRYRELLFD